MIQHGLTESDSEESDLLPCGFWQLDNQRTLLCGLLVKINQIGSVKLKEAYFCLVVVSALATYPGCSVSFHTS